MDALHEANVEVEPAVRVLDSGFEIAVNYDRAVYDALFVALSKELKLPGITADEPLYNAVHKDFPLIMLLRDTV